MSTLIYIILKNKTENNATGKIFNLKNESERQKTHKIANVSVSDGYKNVENAEKRKS